MPHNSSRNVLHIRRYLPLTSLLFSSLSSNFWLLARLEWIGCVRSLVRSSGVIVSVSLPQSVSRGSITPSVNPVQRVRSQVKSAPEFSKYSSYWVWSWGTLCLEVSCICSTCVLRNPVPTACDVKWVKFRVVLPTVNCIFISEMISRNKTHKRNHN